MKIYLIESTKGNIQLATSIYLHDGFHEDIFELSIEGYNKIKDKMQFENHNYVYTDNNMNKWYLRNKGVNAEVYFSNGIKNIREYIINDESDLYRIIGNKRICDMCKVRLIEKRNNKCGIRY